MDDPSKRVILSLSHPLLVDKLPIALQTCFRQIQFQYFEKLRILFEQHNVMNFVETSKTHKKVFMQWIGLAYCAAMRIGAS